MELDCFKNISMDQVETYWDTRPCNVKHSSKELGSKEYFDEVETRKYFVEPHIPVFAEFEKWNTKKVLEIGCGIGTDTINFARSGARITAVDYSGESLRIAQKRAEVYGLDVTFYKANAENLSEVVPIEEYDLIYSFGVIHHTPRPNKVISEIKKYMGKKSVLKIMVYHKYSWKVIWILMKYGKGAFWKISDLIAEYSEAQTGCPVTYIYSKKNIKDLLKGFKVSKFKIDHIFPYKIKEYKEYKYKKTWYFRYLPQVFFHWMECHLGWHLCVDAVINK